MNRTLPAPPERREPNPVAEIAAQALVPAAAERTAERTRLPDIPPEHADWFAGVVLDAVPPTTLAAYRSAAKGLSPHCYDGIPDDVAVLSRIRELESGGRSVSAMRLALAAAQFVRKHSGLDPIGDSPRMAITAIAKTRKAAGEDPKQAAPLRAHHLPAIEDAPIRRRMNESMATAKARRVLDVVIVRLSRIGLMRVSELARATLDDLEPRPSEVGGATLTFRRSKGGREGACVVGARTLALIRAVPRRDGDRRIVPLSRSQIAKRVKQAAKDAGIEGISTHSARVGMTRDLVASGASIPQIQNAGGWRSPTMPAHYARRETAEEGVVAKLYPEG